MLFTLKHCFTKLVLNSAKGENANIALHNIMNVKNNLTQCIILRYIPLEISRLSIMSVISGCIDTFSLSFLKIKHDYGTKA